MTYQLKVSTCVFNHCLLMKVHVYVFKDDQVSLVPSLNISVYLKCTNIYKYIKRDIYI